MSSLNILLRALSVLALLGSVTSFAATLGGALSYPSEGIPAMTIVARDTLTGTIQRVETKAQQTKYSMSVTAGNYVVFAIPHVPPPPPGQPALRGAYTAYSVCGRDIAKLQAGKCQTGPLAEVKLAANDARVDINIDDWYMPDALMASLNLPVTQSPAKAAEQVADDEDPEMRFNAYPATTEHVDKLHAPDFDSAPAAVRNFRTQITLAATKGPAFAGRVAVARWGCGTQCENWALVDLVTGHIVWVADTKLQPILYNLPCEAESLEFRIDSLLLRVRRFDGRRVITQHFLWSDKALSLQKFTEVISPVPQFCGDRPPLR